MILFPLTKQNINRKPRRKAHIKQRITKVAVLMMDKE